MGLELVVDNTEPNLTSEERVDEAQEALNGLTATIMMEIRMHLEAGRTAKADRVLELYAENLSGIFVEFVTAQKLWEEEQKGTS